MKGIFFHLLLALAVLTTWGARPAYGADADSDFLFKDASKPLDARVTDLIGRLKTDEKISLLMMDSPAVPRLGVNAYHWWNEALHGFARHGIATVFPQAIGLAATWDDELHHEVATVISTEARAHHAEALAKGEHGIYSGLTIWSPNINIFRDPRWGRGQETYGEDPFLTSRMGVAFIKGLQGDDPKYFKTVGTAKHYAVHSGPESLRMEFNAKASRRDIWDTYLPAFEACVREAKAGSVMAAYSSVNGVSSSRDPWFLTEVLRKTWGFNGTVVSDVDSVEIIYSRHHEARSPQEGAAMALKAGLDSNSGKAFRNLALALKENLITEADLDRALRNVLTTRFRLGEFDPPEQVPYSKITYAQNATPENDAVALKAARESMVLLRNENNTLPFDKKTIKKIAVIGPNAALGDGLLGNYYGFPARPMTILEGIQAKLGGDVEVFYDKGCEVVEKSPFLLAMVPAEALRTRDGKPGLTGEYFKGQALSGEPALTRTDAFVDFNWQNKPPVKEIPAGDYAVRWTGSITAPTDGNYRLSVTGDDIFRLFLDGKQVVSSSPETTTNTVEAAIDLTPGQTSDLRLEMVRRAGKTPTLNTTARRNSNIRLAWQKYPSTKPAENTAAALARQADAVVLVMGINPSIEGEDLPLRLQGFMGGDRNNIELPAVQQRLIKLAAAAGKPTALVNLSGSAITMPDLPANVALLQAWYPGQHPDAIADVIFGDYNPAGRMPLTVYKSAADLPPFTDYDMANRTYRYFKGEPQFAFGDGLSYTTFAYGNLKINHAAVAAGKPVKVSVDVTNTGRRAGDEVVQLYLSYPGSKVPAPIRALKGFKRVNLKVGATKTVEFTLTPYHLALVDEAGERKVFPGTITIAVGGNQKQTVKTDLKITGQPTGVEYSYVGPKVE